MTKKKRKVPLLPGQLVVVEPNSDIGGKLSLYERPTSTGGGGWKRTGVVLVPNVGIVVACILSSGDDQRFHDVLVLFGSQLGWRTSDNFELVEEEEEEGPQ